VTDLADKDLTEWFISKCPPAFRGSLTKKAEELNFSLHSLVTHITSYKGDYDPVYADIAASEHGHKFKGTSDRQPRTPNRTDTRPSRPSTTTFSKDKPKDFKTRNRLPGSSKDLPEQLRKDKDLCKVYDNTNVFSNVCFKCGSSGHHTRQCSNESPLAAEKEHGAEIENAYKKVITWAKNNNRIPRETAPS
jgi:hypothetical protein